MSKPDVEGRTTGPKTTEMIKPALLGAASVVAIGLALGSFAIMDYQDKVEARELDFTRLTQAKQRLAQLNQDVSQARAALPRYQSLKRQGIFSSLDKAREIDRFESLAGQRPAGVKSFSLGALELLPAPSDLPLSRLDLGRHELTFDATPRHEIHLLGLLDDLRRSLHGLALVRACSLQRSMLMNRAGDGGQDQPESDRINLHAQCSIDWYLFNERQQPDDSLLAAPEPEDI